MGGGADFKVFGEKGLALNPIIKRGSSLIPLACIFLPVPLTLKEKKSFFTKGDSWEIEKEDCLKREIKFSRSGRS